MSIQRAIRLAVLVSGVIIVAATGRSAQAVGYWNLPGTYCQYFGYGNGPGHHVPMVLGPVCCDGWLGLGVHRLPCAPTPGSANANCANCSAQDLSPLFQTSRLP